MLYWLIPYLVAFNATGSKNWPHGPEYLFTADMEASMQLENNGTTMSKYEIIFSCRPLNESSIRCDVESFETKDDEIPEEYVDYEIKEFQRDSNDSNWNFEVQFDKNGVRSIAFLNTEEEFRCNIIRAVFDVINIGSDFVSKVKIGTSLLSNEVSSMGVCDANLRVETTPGEVATPAPRVDLYLDVPSFTKRSENETLVISKERKPNNCSVKKPYFFSNQPSPDDNTSYNVTIFETAVFFSRHHFGGITSKLGRLEMKYADPEHSDTTRLMSGLVKEITRVRLEAIRGAPKQL